MTALPTISPLGKLPELGFYGLAGHSDAPRDLLTEVRQGEELGLGTVFISERFSTKDAATLCGAAAAVTETLGIATAATNHNTRHALVTATFATTMHRLSGGRFALGFGRGFDRLFLAMGLPPVTNAQIEDAASVLRRLWKGEQVVRHDGPAGKYLSLQQDARFNEDIPILLVAMGPRTLEFAGRVADAVVLHTFFDDAAVTAAVTAVRRSAEVAGRDPVSVRVWSVLATIGDHIDYDIRMKKTVGRMASYLRGYGDVLVNANGWDPAALNRFREDPFVRDFRGSLDGYATTSELEYLATVIPEAWLATAATGTPDQCVSAINHQFDLGVDSVILHGATPHELAPILPAYRAARSNRFAKLQMNPGWM